MNRIQLWVYLYGNRVALLAFITNLTTAAVKTAPTPGAKLSRETLYAWAYDWFHQVFNITNTRLNTQQTLTPPEAPTTPKA